MDYYSLKMRASQHVGEGENSHEQHISGAERIVSRESVEAVCSAMVHRAMTHSKGDPDFINVKIEKIRESDIQVLKALPVTRVDVETWQEGLEKAFGLIGGAAGCGGKCHHAGQKHCQNLFRLYLHNGSPPFPSPFLISFIPFVSDRVKLDWNYYYTGGRFDSRQ